MGYYLRHFTHSSAVVPLSELRAAVGDYSIESKDADATWKQFTFVRPDGTWICEAERDSHDTELFNEELAEFVESLDDAEPATGAAWVREYLTKVVTIYAFQMTTSSAREDDWNRFYTLREAISRSAPGIGQADAEGFSNQDGYQITFEFREDVSGLWWVAVRIAGDWVSYRMDLGNKEHRAAFKSGRLAPGVKPERFS